MAGMAEADVMQAKGYNQKDVMQADVQKSFMESFGGLGSAISEILGTDKANGRPELAGGMAAAGTGISSILSGLSPKSVPVASGAWDCACGQKGITGNFCSNCGSRRPVSGGANTWDCSCGRKGNTGNFCDNCGARRPEAKPAAWDCVCGRKGITGNFCDNCGRKREG